MPDRVFSSARLRGYRVLEQEGLGRAPEFQILNTITSARLWLPLSLIEIAFRNAVDTAVTAAHPAGGAWLCEVEEGEIDWGRVVGRPIFRRESEAVAGVDGAEAAPAPHDDADDAPADPVAIAARMAARHGRPVVARDDVIAHLMLGFWVFRGPAGLLREDPPIDVYELLTEQYEGAFGTADDFKSLMTSDILLTRNRVAHHEPVVIRARYIFDKKTGAPRTGNDLVTSLIGALGKFGRLVDAIIETARQLAPMAAEELDKVKLQIEADTGQLSETLNARFGELKLETEMRRAMRREAWERENAGDTES